MSETNALSVVSDMKIQDLAQALAKSGFFAEVKDAAQAIVKIVYGQELGIGPVTAMRGVYFSNGKPCLDAGLISALIKRSGKYDYEIKRLDNDGCELQFTMNGKPLSPVITFNKEDAVRAGLTEGRTSANYKKYPRNMYFARALTNGARWHCADVFGGAIYTPDELDGETVELSVESSDVVTAEVKVVESQARMVKNWAGSEVDADALLTSKITATPRFQQLFGSKYENKFALEGHLKKHFGVEKAADLNWEQAIAWYNHLYNGIDDPKYYPTKTQNVSGGLMASAPTYAEALAPVKKQYKDAGHQQLFTVLESSVTGSPDGVKLAQVLGKLLGAIGAAFANPPTDEDIAEMKDTLAKEFGQ